MGAAYFIMAILGCGDAQADCREVRLVETRFESGAACAAATAAMLYRSGDIDYPVVMAKCRPAGPIMAANPVKPRG